MTARRRDSEGWFNRCRQLQREIDKINRKQAELEQQLDAQWETYFAKASAACRNILGPEGYRENVWPRRRTLLAERALPPGWRTRRKDLRIELNRAEFSLRRRTEREGLEIA